MTTDQLRELEKRLSEAKGPERGLDILLFGWLTGDDDLPWPQHDVKGGTFRHWWNYAEREKKPRDHFVQRWCDRSSGIPAYTASLDAAVALVERVLPDWLGITVGPKAGRDGPWAQLVRNPASYSSPEITVRNAATPALALCLAAIRAIAGSAAE